MTTSAARDREHDKYEQAYRTGQYRMGAIRKADARMDLEGIAVRGGYLDVGCGRGEMIDYAESLGFTPAIGVEMVSQLIDEERVTEGQAHDLPFDDNSVAVATMFDVIEHLIPGDDEAACRELARVATDHVLLTANNRPSKNHIGQELHINKRPYDEWDALFRKWFPGKVIWLNNRKSISESWRIDLQG